MSLKSAFTDEQKAAFVALAQAKGRKAAAKKAKVSTVTISAWAKERGVTFTRAAKGERQSQRAPPGSSPYLRGPQL